MIKESEIISKELKEVLKTKDKKLLLDAFTKFILKQTKDAEEVSLPVSIFIKELGPLEAICKYLKENLEFSYKKIASLINRDERTVWSSYHNALKKIKNRFLIKSFEFSIPISIISNRNLSTLENIVVYFKEKLGMRFVTIAKLLQRSQQNVLTAYKRARKKNVK